jgi:transposase
VKHLPMRPEEDAIVRERWAAGVRDTHIAEELGRSQSMIHRTRKRLGLLPTYGRGRPRKQEQRT